LLPGLVEMVTQQPDLLAFEIEDVANWWASGTPHFHTWRALRAGQPVARMINQSEAQA